jgi:hypothetical protein
MSDYLSYTVENGEVYEHRDILEIPPSVNQDIVEEDSSTE